ncbi:MAG: c-type cytochrome [Parvibaculum sp.]|nr:c-type cytochrome [Parvibaculum sp.]
MSVIDRCALLRVMPALFLANALFACSDNEAKSMRLSDAEARIFINQKSCNACHEVDETRIGPAFRDVATRYEDDAETEVDRLAEKIIAGGAGSWGYVPMISYPDITSEEARAISLWILELNKPKS